MKNNMSDKIDIDRKELEDILQFIDSSLNREFERYTDNYICGGLSWEDGRRKMNPRIYDLREKLEKQITREVV